MPPRHLPTLWLFTDPRMGESLWAALDRLPKGSGVVFRHHGAPDRRALFERVRRIARARRLLLLLAGPPGLARAWSADGWHGRRGHGAGLNTYPAHNRRELVAARRRGAALAFLSPVFPTRSHPGGRVLGQVRFGLTARNAGLPVIALGGMTPDRARIVAQLGGAGWAAIDGLGY